MPRRRGLSPTISHGCKVLGANLPIKHYSGLAIRHPGGVTRLKWHCLCRSLADPLFSPQALSDGMRLGASMEIDLRVRADGGFVLLHDAELDGETTGRGLVREAHAADLRALQMKDGGAPLTLSEDLSDMLGTAHPEALLQFDMKDDLAMIGERGMDHLQSCFRNAGRQVIVSGSDLDLIIAVKQRLRGVRRGIDPSDKLHEIGRDHGLAAMEKELLADLDGPTEADTVYLHWPLVLETARKGLDLIGLCHDRNRLVDAWTYNPRNPQAGFDDAEWRDFSALMALNPDQITTDEAPAIERAWAERQP